jgi:hypothetical protein
LVSSFLILSISPHSLANDAQHWDYSGAVFIFDDFSSPNMKKRQPKAPPEFFMEDYAQYIKI